MNAGLRAFLARLIDYAGLFPPASLELEPAIRNYAAYRAGPDAWMLGRFICPAARLAELDPFMPLFGAPSARPTPVHGSGAGSADLPPLQVAALGRRSADAAACLDGLREDLAQVAAFRGRHAGVAAVDVLELPLPPGAPSRELLGAVADAAHEHGLRAFCEAAAPHGAGWESAVTATLEAIAAHNAGGGPALGFKLRTGGVTAEAFPSVGQVAHALLACRERGVALKCTAGLHHPFRQHRQEVGAKMHGFVNVFAAGILAHAHPLDRAAAESILADEDPASFTFTDDGLAWRGLQAPTATVERLRAAALVSFGSCSFDEPREDLRRLGRL
ncbi:MAG TPA: hypothetical protein VNL77_14770 [Roseiflexaceae bacterium]|nr:hypothetical protein [Roseiflexaceae bacterium]